MSKYNATCVKMLVNAVDDVMMIKFKQGWFTLIKYEHQVGELKNQKPREELLEFIKLVKEHKQSGEGDFAELSKPDTWISKSNIKIENKFLKEAQSISANQTTSKKESNPADVSAYLANASVTPPKGSFSAGRPTSQSKVAQKRARQQAALRAEASGGAAAGKRPGLTLPSFKKNLKLKLGGDAIDKDDLEDKPIQDRGVGNSMNIIDEKVEGLEEKQLQIESITNEPQVVKIQGEIPHSSQQNQSEPISSIKPIYGDQDDSSIKKQQISQGLNDSSPKQLMINAEISTNEPLRNPISSKNGGSQKEVTKDPGLTLKPIAILDDSQISQDFLNVEKVEQEQQLIQDAQSFELTMSKSDKQLKQFAELMSKIEQRNFYKKLYPNKIQCTLFEKVYFDRYKQFVMSSRRDEFIQRIQLIEFRNQRTKPLRKSFDCMKVNSLAREVQAYTQDKFQYYLKYVRKLCNILNTSGLTSPQIHLYKKRAFHHWRAQTYFLQTLEEKSFHLRELNEGCEDPNLIQEAQTHLIDSVYLHKESINWLQNDNVIYLKELKMQNYSSRNAVDTSTRQFIAALNNTSMQSTSIQQQPVFSKLSENKTKFYALILSKVEKVQKSNLVYGFDRIWTEGLGGDPAIGSIDNSLYRLQKIRRHVMYLRKVKNSVESRYSSTRLVQPLITTTTTAIGGNSQQNYPQTGNIVQTNQSAVVPATTSASAKDKQHYYSMMKIQIETPGQPHSKVGPLNLPIDPQLSVDSRQSFNAAFENSVNNRQGTTPQAPQQPFGRSVQLQPTINQSSGNQIQPARTPNGPWEGSLIVPTIDDHYSQGTATDQLTPVVIETTTSNLTPVQAPRINNATTLSHIQPLSLQNRDQVYSHNQISQTMQKMNNPNQPASLAPAFQNQQIGTTPQAPSLPSQGLTLSTASYLPFDRDAIFLYHIERQLSENIGLVKLYRGLKVSQKSCWSGRPSKVDHEELNRQTYQQYTSVTSFCQDEIEEAIERNRQRIKAVQKIAIVRLKVETFQKRKDYYERSQSAKSLKGASNGFEIKDIDDLGQIEKGFEQNGNELDQREQQANQLEMSHEAFIKETQIDGDMKDLASAFSKWQYLSQNFKLTQNTLILVQQRQQSYKSALQTLNQYFNANTGCVEQAFDQWKNTIIIKKVMLGGSTLVQPYGLNFGRQLASQTHGGHIFEPSNHFQSPSMIIQDQKVYQKLHSFMLIKQLMLKLYMERGTVLQKYIGMLKYLAREQNRLHQAQVQTRDRAALNSSRHQKQRRRADVPGYMGNGSQNLQSGSSGVGQSVSSAALHRKYQQEAALIEENVSKLMRCIFRIVFNKWSLYTYHQLTNIQKPRFNATTQLFSAINRLINRRKLIGMSQLHLYSLHIREITMQPDYFDEENDSIDQHPIQSSHIALLKRQVPSISLDQKLKRSRVSLKLCESLLLKWRFQTIQKKFSQWKSNCAIIEWRLNQGLLEGNTKPNEQTSEQIQILLKEPGLIDSQHLQKILEDLRSEQKESQKQKPVSGSTVSQILDTQLQQRGDQILDEKAVIRQMLTDFQNARGSEGVKQFYQNYYTPKSAALKQQQQKPWEIKMQREAMKQIAIYRGATRSESMLTSTSMPSEKDSSLRPIINASFDRLILMRALRVWQKILKEPVGRPEIRAMKRLFEKIRKRRISKGFLIWKHSEIAEDTYTLQSELMDQRTIETLSQVGKDLNLQLVKIKEQYKDQIRIRVVNRMFNFMKSTNPVIEAFNLWKQETLELLTQKYAIRQTIADKEELRQQYELLNERNKQIVDEHVKSIQKGCYKKSGQVCFDCAEIQVSKINGLTELNINKSNYRELVRLVGPKGMRRLLGSQHHALQEISQISQASSAFGSSSDGDEDESQRNSRSPLRSQHSSVMKFAGDKHLERAGGGKINMYQRKINQQSSRHLKAHPCMAAPATTGEQSTRADALAQAIEAENQKLQQKSEKVKMQLREKEQYVESERIKYRARIQELRQLRDQLMDQYEAKMGKR